MSLRCTLCLFDVGVCTLHRLMERLLFASGTAIPHTPNMPCLIATVIVFTAAQMCHVPTARSLAADVAPEQLQGRYIALLEWSKGWADLLRGAV
jgi:dipeptide/tripeptide permease